MKRAYKIVAIALLAIAVVVPSVLAYASETQTYLFSKDMEVDGFIAQDDFHVANITDSGVLVADLYFRIEHSIANLSGHRMRFSIWHTEDSELDSMTLRFSTQPLHVLTIYIEASSYVWSAAQFNRDNWDVVFSVRNLGWYGTGTVTLDFILDSHEQGANLRFTVDLGMHKHAFLQLTSLKAQAYLDTPIPG